MVLHKYTLAPDQMLYVDRERDELSVYTTFHDRPETAIDRLCLFNTGTVRGYEGDVEVFSVTRADTFSGCLEEVIGNDLADALRAAPEVDKAPAPFSESEPHRQLLLNGTDAASLAKEFAE